MCPTVSRSLAHTNRIAYLIVLAGIGAALHIWKLPPALPALQQQLGLSLVESGFLLSIVQIGGMSLGLIVGLVAQKIGLRRCILIGLGLIASASGVGAFVDSKEALMALRGLEGAGFLMVVMPAPALIRQFVPPERLSSLMGLWGCYIPLATIVALLGGSWLLSMADWRLLWGVLTLVTFALFLLVWVLVPSDSQQVVAKQKRERIRRVSAWQLVKTTLSAEGVWLSAGIFGLYAGQWIAVIGFLPTIYMLGGISGTTAGVLTAIVAGANAIGTFAAGYLLHRGARVPTLIIIGLIAMILTAFAAFALNLPVFWRFFAIFVFSTLGGLIPTSLFVVVMQLAPSQQTVPTSLGWMQQISALGQFLGPPLIAWVATLVGGWQATWVATGLCAILAILLALRMRYKFKL